MKRVLKIVLSIALLLAFLSTSLTLTVVKVKSIKPNAANIKTSTDKKGKFNMKVQKNIEIYGVSVVPHVVSGEIPGYEMKDPFAVPDNLGSLISIFVCNRADKGVFEGKVLFNGKTGTELLNEKIVSWCNVPDTRSDTGHLSTDIPAQAIDRYVLNIIDSSFYKNGITVTFFNKENQLIHEQKIKIAAPDIYASRIVFSATDNSRKPDGMYVFLENKSKLQVEVKDIKIWTAPEHDWMHWWNRSIKPTVVTWSGKEGIIEPGSLSTAYIEFGNISYGETIFEFSVQSENGTEKLLYVLKPMVIDYDINLGWPGDSFKSELYAKTMKLMHFNTIHGYDSSYFLNHYISSKYPMKTVLDFTNIEFYNQPQNLKNIHGVEFLGEPQLNKAPAQDIYNKYSKYRLSAYPTTLTLSHEPEYYLYAGLADFPHFDAYRVVAPHADKWGEYKKYGNKNSSWGAPLETVGFYMRTLHQISMPNPVAAWTQGVADGWSSIFRITAPNPNNLEMRIQAYQMIANGALSLYWFNLNGKSVIQNRKALAEIQNINREVLTVDALIERSVPFSWKNRFMDMDLNILAGMDFALLFACDLKYKVSPVNQFVSRGKRKISETFELPGYLKQVDSVVKVSHSGIKGVNAEISENKVKITDLIDVTGMYVVYNSKTRNIKKELETRYTSLLKTEKSYNFNPIEDTQDYDALREEIEKVNP